MNDLKANGVRIRRDQAGDSWADQHRDQLGRWFHMQDVDAFMGHFAFAKNSGDALFMEYVPDNYTNRMSAIRQFAIVALFDRKKTRDAAMSPSNVLCLAFYLFLCRTLGIGKPRTPKFFYVVGEQSPWTMIEVDVFTGDPTGGEWSISHGDWKQVWNATGLVTMRQEMERWIQKAPTPVPD